MRRQLCSAYKFVSYFLSLDKVHSVLSGEVLCSLHTSDKISSLLHSAYISVLSQHRYRFLLLPPFFFFLHKSMFFVIWSRTMKNKLRILHGEEQAELPRKRSCVWSHETRISTGEITCWKFLKHGSHTVELEISLQVISVQHILWADKQPCLDIARNTTCQPLPPLSKHT